MYRVLFLFDNVYLCNTLISFNHHQSMSGEGITPELASCWYEQVCESDHYFAGELTEGGGVVLASTGHLDGEPATAREVLSLTSMGFA